MTPPNIIVIGAGVGGIAAATRLAQRGYRVTVLEKNPIAGGRLGFMQKDGHRFDTGPTLFIMPEIYAQTFDDLGERMQDHLELIRVDPTYHIHFADGTSLTLTSDLHTMQRQMEAIEPGSFSGLLRYLDEAGRHYRVSLRNLVQRDFRSLPEFFSPGNLLLFLRLKALVNHYRHVGDYFEDPRLKMAFTFQDLYMGLSPFEAPAIFSLLQYTELAHGVWFPKGGMYSVVEALCKIAEKAGVRFLYNTPVEQINVNGQKTTGVTLTDGRQLPADIVIANADLPYVYRHLLPDDGTTARLERKKYGCSAIVFYWGLDQQYPQLAAHNLFMASDQRRSFDQIFDGTAIPEEPNFYVHIPAHLDSSLTPGGHDTFMAAIPVSHLNEGTLYDWPAIQQSARQTVLQRLEEHGMAGIEDHLKFEVCFGPQDWRTRYNLIKGATHGLSHHLSQMGYLRPRNRHARYRNLYFVGASTHPGTGLPSVLVSARLVTERILREV